MIKGAPAALAWQWWRRSRFSLFAASIYIAVAAPLCHILPADGVSALIALYLVTPTAFVFVRLLTLFTFAGNVDLASCDTGFPSRMFTLPVSTYSLVIWPMLYGMICIAFACLLLNGLMLRPRGVTLPWVWPPLFVAVLLAWVQALLWRPFQFQWARLITAVIVLGAYICGVIAAVHFGVSKFLLVIGVLVQIPLTYIIALRGVARARCGESEESPQIFIFRRFRGRSDNQRPKRVKPFIRSIHAQVWFEWRLNGKTLPVMMGFMSMFLVGLAWMTREDSSHALRMISALLLFQLIGCVSGAPGMARFQTKGDVDAMPSFMAVRPIPTGDLVMAKFRAAAISVLACCGVTLAAGLAICLITDAGRVLLETFSHFVQQHSLLEAISLLAYAGLLFPLTAWLLVVNNVWVGLTGRKWFVIAYFAVAYPIFMALGGVGMWLYSSASFRANVFPALPWILGAAAFVKAAAVVKIFQITSRRGLLRRSMLYSFAFAWLAFITCNCAFVFVYAPQTPYLWKIVPSAFVLATPILGIALAPLALDWNRRR